MISALDRKLLRDLSQMKGQSFAIAIVIAAGVATFVNSRTIVNSLELTRSTFYERYRFADVFARVKRAPDSMADRLAEIPGVAQVETRIVELVTLDVPGLAEPAVGQLISLPVTRPPRLNQLYLRRGRQLAVGRDDEVLASEAFMKANNIDLGSTIRRHHQWAAERAAHCRRGVLARVRVSNQAGRHAARPEAFRHSVDGARSAVHRLRHERRLQRYLDRACPRHAGRRCHPPHRHLDGTLRLPGRIRTQRPTFESCCSRATSKACDRPA